MQLLINSAAGIYIPQWFAEQYQQLLLNPEKHKGDIQILLSGPDHPEYWDAWQDILDSELTNGCQLYHNEDLWLLEDGEEWPEW